MEALNQVRRRAYGLAPGTAAPDDYVATAYNAATFQDLVLRERAYEFHYLGKRWLDLKRTGKVKQAIQDSKKITVADKHLLWPIPNSELNFNKALDPSKDQNPGY
jgi:starch-binding outer membrane protein, SusD/RagB family